MTWRERTTGLYRTWQPVDMIADCVIGIEGYKDIGPALFVVQLVVQNFRVPVARDVTY